MIKSYIKANSQDRVSLEYALPIVGRFLTGSHTIRKTGILLLRKQEEGYLKWDVSQRKNWKKWNVFKQKMSTLERRMQFLKVERTPIEGRKEQEEKRKLSEDW